MEAKEIKNIQLNVGANFQAQVVETVCSVTISRVTGLQIGDKVQIYPNTVNSHVAHVTPKTVAVRKLIGEVVTGPFIVLPLGNLNLSEKQFSLITKINLTAGSSDPHLTYVKQINCSKVLERATGLRNGCKVKFYPYSIDVIIEEEEGIFSVSPLITIAVRLVKKGLVDGNFVLMNVADLNLNSGQQEELQDIIFDGLSVFTNQESVSRKDAKFLFKKLKREISFTSEEAVLDLNEA